MKTKGIRSKVVMGSYNVVRPAFECAQHPKAGQNTQQFFFLIFNLKEEKICKEEKCAQNHQKRISTNFHVEKYLKSGRNTL